MSERTIVRHFKTFAKSRYFTLAVMKRRHIVLVGFDRITAMDLVGPLEAFGSAHVLSADGRALPCYQITIAGLTGKTFRSEFGLGLVARCPLSAVRAVDTLIVPGGSGLREPKANARLSRWIGKHGGGIRRVASVCTGIYGLASTGLLNGRIVSTHWRFCADVSAKFPKLKMNANALYVRDGKFWTSAGVTAGIDLSLALIEEDFGPEMALSVAREMVVFVKRLGGQDQYSEPLQFQVESRSRFADLLPWMMGHLDRDLSVESLAERMCLCPRQFTRRFKLEMKTTPASFVRRLRLDEARKRLAMTGSTVDNVARSVGFRDGDNFRRAFERSFGVPPSIYRGRFAPHGVT
jgi:transcriptional regulator GlxA family with amidase domain